MSNAAIAAPSPSLLSVLIDTDTVAQLLQCSKRHVVQLNQDGRMPRTVPVGARRMNRWRRAEILAWAEAGCPTRAVWETMPHTWSRAGSVA